MKTVRGDAAKGVVRTVEMMRDYLAAFLDANLRGETLDPLLVGTSPAYPDAVVTEGGIIVPRAIVSMTSQMYAALTAAQSVI